MIDYNLVNKYIGNMEIFKKVSKVFITEHSPLLNEASLLSDYDLERNVHSIKGVSLNLGLKDLYDKSVSYLSIIRSGKNIKESLDEYLMTLKKAIDDLNNI